MNTQLRVAALISGGASTAAAIHKAFGLVVAIASNSTAGASLRELVHPPEIIKIRRRDFETDHAYGLALRKELQARRIDFVGQYGFFGRTPQVVIDAYYGVIINQHPCILRPDHRDFGGDHMYGIYPHCARMHYMKAVKGDFWTEAVSHLVLDERYDAGPVVHKERIEVDAQLVAGFPENNGCKQLQKLVLPVEHRVQIETVYKFSKGDLHPIQHEGPAVSVGKEGILVWAKAQAVAHHPKD